MLYFFFSSRRRHTRLQGDWSSDVCSSDLPTRARCPCYESIVRITFNTPGLEASSIASTPWSSFIRRWTKIGRASCRERGEIAVGAGSREKKSDEEGARRVQSRVRH